VTALVLVLVLFGAPSEAVSRAHFVKAQKSFAQHDWRKALDEFTAASESAPVELPDLYFDIAQCHRNLGHARQAVLAFEKYLALKPEAADRQKVRALIVQLGGKVAEEAAVVAVEEPVVEAPQSLVASPAPSFTSPSPITSTITTTPTITPTSTSGAAKIDLVAEPVAKPKRRWPIWVGVGAAVGLTAIAVGVGVGVGTSSSHGATPGTPMLGSAGTFDTRGH
jgi:hypothetical protein